jgi:hypothetical protein
MENLVKETNRYTGRVSEIYDENSYAQIGIFFPDPSENSLSNVEQIIIVLKGQTRLFLDGELLTLNRGDILVMLKTKEHFIADQVQKDSLRFNIYPPAH